MPRQETPDLAIDEDRQPAPRRIRHGGPPAFNVPGVVLATIAVLVVIHAIRILVLSPDADDLIVSDFAFIPACYSQDCKAYFPHAAGAAYWSPLSHAFLHGDWTHLGLNTIWFLAFGTPIARRVGALRFLAFSASGAVAGALLFYVLNPTLMVPVIGASGVVSALTGGACRFAFGTIGRSRYSAERMPLLTVGEALSDRTILFFVFIFFALNLLTASGFGGFMSGDASVAWEAHVGGFLFGFLCFELFEPRRRWR